MTHVLISHEVREFDPWKDVFDEHAETRREAGSTGGELFRSAANPEHVVILFEWESAERAREFLDSGDLRETMDRAGVVGDPDVTVLESVESVEV